MGYSFSVIHALAYSFVGMQTLYLATHFNPIYWNTACLIVNSGSLENNAEELETQPETTTKTKKVVSTDYAKIARAIGAIQRAGIKIGLVDINKSQFGFIPDVENNQILFGLKGMLHVSDDAVKAIIENRPYISIKDFINKVNPKKQTMISLIKGGAFDNFLDRKTAMGWYLWETCDKKSSITLQNLPALIKYQLLPDTADSKLAFKVYEFTRYLKSKCKFDDKYYHLDTRAINFLESNNLEDYILVIDQHCLISIKEWNKVYQFYISYFKKWINDNHALVKDTLNKKILFCTISYIRFKKQWIR